MSRDIHQNPAFSVDDYIAGIENALPDNCLAQAQALRELKLFDAKDAQPHEDESLVSWIEKAALNDKNALPLTVIVGETRSPLRSDRQPSNNVHERRLSIACTCDGVAAMEALVGLLRQVRAGVGLDCVDFRAAVDEWSLQDDDIPARVKKSHLLVVGTPEVNIYACFLHRLAHDFYFGQREWPPELESAGDKMHVAGQLHQRSPRGEEVNNCGVVLLLKNPWNPDYRVLWVAGLTGRGTGYGCSLIAADWSDYREAANRSIGVVFARDPTSPGDQRVAPRSWLQRRNGTIDWRMPREIVEEDDVCKLQEENCADHSGRSADGPEPSAKETPPRRNSTASTKGERSNWILLLSDLHIDADTNIDTMHLALTEDLRTGPGKTPKLSALVVAGDLTNRATPEEFAQAMQLILRLNTLPGISQSNTVVVPGNHDVAWSHPDVYRLHDGARPDGLGEHEFILDGKLAAIRDAQKYQESFGNFSHHVYQAFYGRPYPLEPAQQVEVFDLEASGLCFVSFNSAWNTARHSPGAATIFEGAVNEALRRLRDVDRSRLKIAVWHHPITGNEKIKDDAFVERLRNAGVCICLHGHIHESSTDLLGYLHPRSLHAVGTGSFGAKRTHRPESTPRLYQLLEISPDRSSVRVHTRSLDKLGGPWEPWCKWPDPKNSGLRQPYYDFRVLDRL